MSSSINSPCSQIDSVKGAANILKVQAQAGGPKYSKVEAKLTDVSDAVRTGDPKKAQSALDTAKATFKKAEAEDSTDSATSNAANDVPRIQEQTDRKLEAYA